VVKSSKRKDLPLGIPEMIHFPGWNHFLYGLGVNLLATILAALFGFGLFLLWRRFYLPLFGSRNPEHDLNGLW
jgi:hypothetical protein